MSGWDRPEPVRFSGQSGPSDDASLAPVDAVESDRWPDQLPGGLLMTVEQVALLWFGEVGGNGSASSNCQKIRRLIPHVLPARRIGNRWYVSRAAAEEWAAGADSELVMAHPETR